MKRVEANPCEEQWQALAGAAGPPLQQSWAYGAVMAALGARVRRVRLGNSGLQLLQRGPMRLALRGPLGGSAAEKAEILRAAAPLIATPDEGSAVGLALLTARSWADWLLHGDLVARATPKFRARVLKARRGGLNVRVSASLDEGHWLLARDEAQRRARGYRSHPRRFLEAWESLAALRVVTVSQGFGPVAGALFLLHGNSATYQLAHVTQEGRAALAGHLALMTGAEVLVDSGITRLDLGTVESDRAPGLARFKLSAGASLRQMEPTVLVPPPWLGAVTFRRARAQSPPRSAHC